MLVGLGVKATETQLGDLIESSRMGFDCEYQILILHMLAGLWVKAETQLEGSSGMGFDCEYGIPYSDPSP